MNAAKILLPMSDGGAAPASLFDLRDLFTTAHAAPLVSPRTCEPGPGTLTLTDTGNKMTTSASSLVVTGAVSAYTDPRITGATQLRTPGRVFYFRNKGALFEVGYRNSG